MRKVLYSNHDLHTYDSWWHSLLELHTIVNYCSGGKIGYCTLPASKQGRGATLNLEAFFCVCAILPDPFTSIVEKHVQGKLLGLELLHKFAYTSVQTIAHFVVDAGT